MIKSIFFDIEAIFITVDFEKFIFKASQQSKRAIEFIREYLNTSPLIRKYSLGKVNTDTFLKQLKKEIDFTGDTFQLADIWNEIIFEPINYNIEICRQLKSFYKLYAISNTNELHYKKISSWGIYEILDKIFLSFQLGVSKPDKQIFKIALESTNSNPKESIFIDDEEINVKVAQQIGFITQTIKNPTELRTILINLGIKILKNQEDFRE